MPGARRSQPLLPFWLLAICFFGSGLTGLIYEIIWTRRLQLTFGSTTYSITTVLAAFMAGLGVGSWLIGRRVDQSRLGGVRIYALLELGVGLYALVSLPLLAGVELVYAWVQRWLQLGQLASTWLKFLLAFPVLAIPAGLMGGTLPALVRAVVRSRAKLHSEASLLYGLNTVGAATGTVAAGLLFIEVLGLRDAVWLAAAVNLAIAGVVLHRVRRATEKGRRAEGQAEPEEQPEAQAPAAAGKAVRLRQHLRAGPVLFCAVAVTLTGFLSMLYEIVWTRLLALVVGSSTYAFTIVLGVFLLGLALGALLYARLSRGRPPTVLGLSLLLLGLAVWVSLTISMLPVLPALLVRLGQIPGTSLGDVLLAQVLFALLILLVPTLLLGAALPLSMGIIARSLGQVGGDVGGVYLANTLGSVTGSVLAGFLLVPLIGTRHTLLVGVMLNVVLVLFGLWTFAGSAPRRVAGIALGALVAALALLQPPWPAHLFDSGLAVRLRTPPARSRLALEQRLTRSPGRVLFLEEGVNATVSVRQLPEATTLLINGKPDASTGLDMSTQVVLGAIAMLLHERPAEVALVGHGSGVSAQVGTFFPELERLDVIEIEAAVWRAGRFFRPFNADVEHHPKVQLRCEDARSYFLTTRRRYDVIVSEPSNPWTTGSGLFSREYYRAAKRSLKRGGIFAQWLQLYALDSESVALVFRTLLEAFPHLQLWHSDAGDVVLLGSDQPLRFSVDRIERAYRADPRLRAYLAAFGPGPDPAAMAGAFLLDRPALQRMAKRFDDEILTDVHPTLEYNALRGLYGTWPDHILDLWRVRIELGPPLPPARGSTPGLGAALDGGITLLARHNVGVADAVSAALLRRYPHLPQIRLARARELERAGRSEGPLPAQLLAALPAAARDDAALFDARLLLKRGELDAARRRLESVSEQRGTARRWLEATIAVRQRRFTQAWPLLDTVIGRFDDLTDSDAMRLDRSNFYELVGELVRASGDAERAVRLLARRRETAGGELQRLLQLANALVRLGRAPEAARVMDEVGTYGPVSIAALALGEQIYAAAGEGTAAAALRGQRYHFSPPPGPSLWPGQPSVPPAK